LKYNILYNFIKTDILIKIKKYFTKNSYSKSINSIVKMIENKISIITVTFNVIDTIEETILSVINQNDTNFEYIIIDGGSTDGTLDIIEKYQYDIAYWHSMPDNGIYDAMNKGVRVSNGNFINFLGGDDVFINNNVLSKVRLFLQDAKKIYYGNVLFKKRNVIYDGQFNSFKIVTRNISHQSIFYPTKVFEEFTFNTSYKIYADYDLNLKLYNHSLFSFKFIPVLIALFNDEGLSGMNTKDINFEKDRLNIIKNHFSFYIYFYRKSRTIISLIMCKVNKYKFNRFVLINIILAIISYSISLLQDYKN
jgi:glycosyltransferase involved in cell wall biosynthesis